MAQNPSLQEHRALKAAELRAALIERNKQQAREQLLRIQLILAQRPIK
jgi:hypothetical protein